MRNSLRALALTALLPAPALAVPMPLSYYSHLLFDNSLTPNQYFYGRAEATNSSTIQTVAGRLPVETRFFHTPPNALRLQWQSNPNGGWSAEIQRPASIRDQR